MQSRRFQGQRQWTDFYQTVSRAVRNSSFDWEGAKTIPGYRNDVNGICMLFGKLLQTLLTFCGRGHVDPESVTGQRFQLESKARGRGVTP